MKYRFILLSVMFIILLFITSCGKDSTTDDSTTGNYNTDTGGTVSEASTDADEAMDLNTASHESDGDYSFDTADVVSVVLGDSSITINGTDYDSYSGSGFSRDAENSILTITEAGVYSLSGSFSDGQVVVNTADEDTVKIILDGVSVACSDNAPLYIEAATKAVVFLAESTLSSLSDSDRESGMKAVLYSDTDLSICGSGSLSVEANYKDGITAKEGLIINSGTIEINSADDGIQGEDYIIVENGNITVSAGGDGFKTDNDSDEGLGYIYINDGTFDITVLNDGIQADTDIIIKDGDFEINSGGGNTVELSDDSDSCKGIKADVSIVIDDCSFDFDTADDSVHCDGDIVIGNGSFTIKAGDDGIHADTSIEINGGDYVISRSYEGIESALITINGGNFHVTADDDGINVAGGTDFSSPGSFNQSGNYYLYINNGYIVVDSDGDGIDVNGTIIMTGGLVIVNGPTESNNGAIDYDLSFTISGGTLIAAGSAGMAQAPGTASTQYSLNIVFGSNLSPGTIIHIRNSDGDGILTFAPSKSFQSLIFSSDSIVYDSDYYLYTGGSATGNKTDGLYTNGTYTPGTLYGDFTVYGVVTNID